MTDAIVGGTSKLRMPEFHGRKPLGRASCGAVLLAASKPEERTPQPMQMGSVSPVQVLRESCKHGVSTSGFQPQRPSRSISTNSLRRLPAGIGDTASFRGTVPDRPAAGSLTRGDHIRVAVRVRPIRPNEDGIIDVAGNGALAIRKDAATGGNEFLKSQQGRTEERTFDSVFGPLATQREVYEWSCKPLLTAAITQQRSATVFVYGATGAGKTYTMFGCAEQQQRGIIFRAVQDVFSIISPKSSDPTTFVDRSLNEGDQDEPEHIFHVKVSFLEIYNETVRDLLQPGGGCGQCKVLEDERKGVVKVSNLVEVPVSSADEALHYLECGMIARTVESTAANAQSSRAHAVFSLTLEQVKQQSVSDGPLARRQTQEVKQLVSKISLIDLAGSERAAITQNSGAALKDGARINQSLLALANCIDALCTKAGIATPRKKPPYRDSKLTLMLKSSLTGDGLVAMIANVHPGRSHFEDSNNTLEYARRASTVKAKCRRSGNESVSPAPNFPLYAENAVTSGRLSHSGSVTHVTAAVAETSDEAHEDDTTCTTREFWGPPSTGGNSTTSCLPIPPRTSFEEIRRRRKLESAAKGAASRLHHNPIESSRFFGSYGTEATTASTPDDECLSEISLVSPNGACSCDGSAQTTEEPVEIRCEAKHRATIGVDVNNDFRLVSEAGSALEVEEPAEIRCEAKHQATIGVDVNNDFRLVSEAGSALEVEELVPVSDVVLSQSVDFTVTRALIARLQAETTELASKLRRTTEERDTLLCERRNLEEENERLREVNRVHAESIANLLSQFSSMNLQSVSATD